MSYEERGTSLSPQPGLGGKNPGPGLGERQGSGKAGQWGEKLRNFCKFCLKVSSFIQVFLKF